MFLQGKGDNETKEKRKHLGMKNDEVVAVLGHELGHWQLNHNIKNLTIGEVTTQF